MPRGGPAYPLSALGVRLRARLSPSLVALAGVFDGDPLGNDPSNRHGTNFNLRDGALVIAELKYSTGKSDGISPPGAQGDRLPGTYKVGAWYNTERFSDQRFDSTGRSLADPSSNDIPRTHRGDWSLYAVADQIVWRAGPRLRRRWLCSLARCSRRATAMRSARPPMPASY